MINKHQFANQKLMSLSSHGFGEHVSNLEIGGDMWKRNNMSIDSFADRVTIHFNMFGALMEDGIRSNLNSTLLSAWRRVGVVW
jgi:hypothetical protein